ncbi:MAG: phosphopantetheine-binding protein [Planctomycetaceae bacterium]
MSRTTVAPREHDIAGYLSTRLPRAARIAPETELLDSGLLDSLLVMDLIAHLESEYCVRLDHDHVAPAHFRTPAAMARLVDLLQAACAEAL